MRHYLFSMISSYIFSPLSVFDGLSAISHVSLAVQGALRELPGVDCSTNHLHETHAEKYRENCNVCNQLSPERGIEPQTVMGRGDRHGRMCAEPIRLPR